MKLRTYKNIRSWGVSFSTVAVAHCRRSSAAVAEKKSLNLRLLRPGDKNKMLSRKSELLQVWGSKNDLVDGAPSKLKDGVNGKMLKSSRNSSKSWRNCRT